MDVDVNGVLRMACINGPLRRQSQFSFKRRNPAEIRRIVIDRVLLAALAASQPSGMKLELPTLWFEVSSSARTRPCF